VRKEFEIVRLKRDVSGIPKGTLGTVVMVSSEFPSKCLVDFPDREEKELLVIDVDENDLEEGQATATPDDINIVSKIWDATKYKQ
jgi:hypothetical protein